MQLLMITIIAGVTDGMNPVAIAQQLLIQSKTSNQHHILFYIAGIEVTNFIFGLMFYYGFAELFSKSINTLQANLPYLWWAGQALLAIGFIYYGGVRLYQRLFQSKSNKLILAEENNTFNGFLSKKKLFLIGIIACAAELPTAAPYLAYLAYLTSLELSNVTFILLLLLYNIIIFNWPLYLLYIASVLFNQYLDKLYQSLQKIFDMMSHYLLPLASISIGLLWIHQLSK